MDTPQNTCACGCGEDPGVYAQSHSQRGQVKGEPKRWIRGHENRGRVMTPAERAKITGRPITVRTPAQFTSGL